jgi:hypothetical protein
MRTASCLALVLILLSARPSAAQQILAVADTTALRACRVALVEGEQPELRAARCAEDFIRRNGYTSAPPDTSLGVARESIEWEASDSARLQARHGSLLPDALGVCPGARGAPGYTVAFRYAGSTSDSIGRAVTMSPEFTELRVQHPDFRLTVLREAGSGCWRPTGSVPRAVKDMGDKTVQGHR